MISLVRTNSADEAFQLLVRELDYVLMGINGKDHSFFEHLNRIETIPYAVVAYDEGKAIGCGALRPFDVTRIEIKRMFVQPDARLQGVGAMILEELELWARELGYRFTIMETSVQLEAANRLYERHGYGRTEKYGSYVDVETSQCYQKDLL